MERQPGFLLTIITLLLLCIAKGPVAARTTNFTTDQSALLALKSHITNDPHNILTTKWSTTTSICNWMGVTCGVRHLRVTALNLSYMGLTGTIPPHLGNLSFLVKLHFRNNSFHGTLPQELARLRRLQLINFGFNNFMGTIPAWFGSLSKLQPFNIFGNQFSFQVPCLLQSSTYLHCKQLIWKITSYQVRTNNQLYVPIGSGSSHVAPDKTTLSLTAGYSVHFFP